MEDKRIEELISDLERYSRQCAYGERNASAGAAEVMGKLRPLLTQAAQALRELQQLPEDLAAANELIVDMRKEKAIGADFAHDQGLCDARNGTQEVFTDPDAEPESCGYIDGDKPFCRIKWYEDSGDPSVGIQGVAFWCLEDDQSGTELQQLRAKVERFNVTKKVLIEEADFAKNDRDEIASMYNALVDAGIKADGLRRAAEDLVCAIADGWHVDRTSPEFLKLQAILNEANN